jgi:hypothetical protein
MFCPLNEACGRARSPYNVQFRDDGDLPWLVTKFINGGVFPVARFATAREALQCARRLSSSTEG